MRYPIKILWCMTAAMAAAKAQPPRNCGIDRQPVGKGFVLSEFMIARSRSYFLDYPVPAHDVQVRGGVLTVPPTLSFGLIGTPDRHDLQIAYEKLALRGSDGQPFTLASARLSCGEDVTLATAEDDPDVIARTGGKPRSRGAAFGSDSDRSAECLDQLIRHQHYRLDLIGHAGVTLVAKGRFPVRAAMAAERRLAERQIDAAAHGECRFEEPSPVPIPPPPPHG